MMTCTHRIAVSLSRLGRGAWPACTAIALLLANPAQAGASGAGERRIAECIRQAAGGKPWLEKTLWGLRDQEGGWIGAQIRNTNGSHDLGPLQVNSWWVPKIATLVGRPQADVRAWLVSDPCFNTGAARWIFLSALRSTGSYWKAIGAYHSPARWRQERYAASVAGHLVRRFGPRLFALSRSQEVPHPYAPPTVTMEERVSLREMHGPSAAETSSTGYGFGTVHVLDQAGSLSSEEGG